MPLYGSGAIPTFYPIHLSIEEGRQGKTQGGTQRCWPWAETVQSGCKSRQRGEGQSLNGYAGSCPGKGSHNVCWRGEFPTLQKAEPDL